MLKCVLELIEVYCFDDKSDCDDHTLNTLLHILSVTESHDLYEPSQDADGKTLAWLTKLSQWLMKSCTLWWVYK